MSGSQQLVVGKAGPSVDDEATESDCTLPGSPTAPLNSRFQNKPPRQPLATPKRGRRSSGASKKARSMPVVAAGKQLVGSSLQQHTHQDKEQPAAAGQLVISRDDDVLADANGVQLPVHRRNQQGANAVTLSAEQLRATLEQAARAQATLTQTEKGSQQKLGVPLTHGWWRKPRTAAGTAVGVPVPAAVDTGQRLDESAAVIFPPDARWWQQQPAPSPERDAEAGVRAASKQRNASKSPREAPAPSSSPRQKKSASPEQVTTISSAMRQPQTKGPLVCSSQTQQQQQQQQTQGKQKSKKLSQAGRLWKGRIPGQQLFNLIVPQFVPQKSAGRVSGGVVDGSGRVSGGGVVDGSSDDVTISQTPSPSVSAGAPSQMQNGQAQSVAVPANARQIHEKGGRGTVNGVAVSSAVVARAQLQSIIAELEGIAARDRNVPEHNSPSSAKENRSGTTVRVPLYAEHAVALEDAKRAAFIAAHAVPAASSEVLPPSAVAPNTTAWQLPMFASTHASSPRQAGSSAAGRNTQRGVPSVATAVHAAPTAQPIFKMEPSSDFTNLRIQGPSAPASNNSQAASVPHAEVAAVSSAMHSAGVRTAAEAAALLAAGREQATANYAHQIGTEWLQAPPAPQPPKSTPQSGTAANHHPKPQASMGNTVSTRSNTQHAQHRKGAAVPAAPPPLFGVQSTPGAPILLGLDAPWWRLNQNAAAVSTALQLQTGISDSAFAAAVQAAQEQDAAAAQGSMGRGEVAPPPQFSEPQNSKSRGRLSEEAAAEVLLSLQGGQAAAVPGGTGSGVSLEGEWSTIAAKLNLQVSGGPGEVNALLGATQHVQQAQEIDDEATESDTEPDRDSEELAHAAKETRSKRSGRGTQPASEGSGSVRSQQQQASLPALANLTGTTSQGGKANASPQLRPTANQEATMRELEQAVVSLPAGGTAPTSIRGQAAVMALAVLRDQAFLNAQSNTVHATTPVATQYGSLLNSLRSSGKDRIDVSITTNHRGATTKAAQVDMLLAAATCVEGTGVRVEFTGKPVHLRDEDAPDLRRLPGSTPHTTALAQGLAAWGFHVVTRSGSTPVATGSGGSSVDVRAYVGNSLPALTSPNASTNPCVPVNLASAYSGQLRDPRVTVQLARSSSKSVDQNHLKDQHSFRQPNPKQHSFRAPPSLCVTTGTAEAAEEHLQHTREPVATIASVQAPVATTPNGSTGTPPLSDVQGGDMVRGLNLEQLLAHGIAPLARQRAAKSGKASQGAPESGYNSNCAPDFAPEGLAWPPAPLPRLEWSETTTVHSYGNSTHTGSTPSPSGGLQNDASITSKLPTNASLSTEPSLALAATLQDNHIVPNVATGVPAGIATVHLTDAATSRTGVQFQLHACASGTDLEPAHTPRQCSDAAFDTTQQSDSDRKKRAAKRDNRNLAKTGFSRDMQPPLTPPQKRSKGDMPAAIFRAPVDMIVLEPSADAVLTPFAAEMMVVDPTYACTGPPAQLPARAASLGTEWQSHASLTAGIARTLAQRSLQAAQANVPAAQPSTQSQVEERGPAIPAALQALQAYDDSDDSATDSEVDDPTARHPHATSNSALPQLPQERPSNASAQQQEQHNNSSLAAPTAATATAAQNHPDSQTAAPPSKTPQSTTPSVPQNTTRRRVTVPKGSVAAVLATVVASSPPKKPHASKMRPTMQLEVCEETPRPPDEPNPVLNPSKQSAAAQLQPEATPRAVADTTTTATPPMVVGTTPAPVVPASTLPVPPAASPANNTSEQVKRPISDISAPTVPSSPADKDASKKKLVAVQQSAAASEAAPPQRPQTNVNEGACCVVDPEPLQRSVVQQAVPAAAAHTVQKPQRSDPPAPTMVPPCSAPPSVVATHACTGASGSVPAAAVAAAGAAATTPVQDSSAATAAAPVRESSAAAALVRDSSTAPTGEEQQPSTGDKAQKRPMKLKLKMKQSKLRTSGALPASATAATPCPPEINAASTAAHAVQVNASAVTAAPESSVPELSAAHASCAAGSQTSLSIPSLASIPVPTVQVPVATSQAASPASPKHAAATPTSSAIPLSAATKTTAAPATTLTSGSPQHNSAAAPAEAEVVLISDDSATLVSDQRRTDAAPSPAHMHVHNLMPPPPARSTAAGAAAAPATTVNTPPGPPQPTVAQLRSSGSTQHDPRSLIDCTIAPLQGPSMHAFHQLLASKATAVAGAPASPHASTTPTPNRATQYLRNPVSPGYVNAPTSSAGASMPAMSQAAQACTRAARLVGTVLHAHPRAPVTTPSLTTSKKRSRECVSDLCDDLAALTRTQNQSAGKRSSQQQQQYHAQAPPARQGQFSNMHGAPAMPPPRYDAQPRTSLHSHAHQAQRNAEIPGQPQHMHAQAQVRMQTGGAQRHIASESGNVSGCNAAGAATAVHRSNSRRYFQVATWDNRAAVEMGGRWDPSKRAWFTDDVEVGNRMQQRCREIQAATPQVYFDIPAAETRIAKNLGAAWHTERQQWYAPTEAIRASLNIHWPECTASRSADPLSVSKANNAPPTNAASTNPARENCPQEPSTAPLQPPKSANLAVSEYPPLANGKPVDLSGGSNSNSNEDESMHVNYSATLNPEQPHAYIKVEPPSTSAAPALFHPTLPPMGCSQGPPNPPSLTQPPVHPPSSHPSTHTPSHPMP